VGTAIQQTVNFSNEQGFNITSAEYVQDISQLTPVNSTITTEQGNGPSFSTESFLYPLTVGITLTFPNGQTVQTTVVSQEFQNIVANPVFTGSVDNLVNAKDTINFSTGQNAGASSSQQYTLEDSLGQFYTCGIATKGNVLRSVNSGCKETIKFK